MDEIIEKKLRIKCFVTGSEIKNINEITEEDKTQFIPVSDEMLMGMFSNLIDCEVITELQSGLNYEIYSIDWYRDKFPGFDEDAYRIMKEQGC